MLSSVAEAVTELPVHNIAIISQLQPKQLWIFLIDVSFQNGDFQSNIESQLGIFNFFSLTALLTLALNIPRVVFVSEHWVGQAVSRWSHILG